MYLLCMYYQIRRLQVTQVTSKKNKLIFLISVSILMRKGIGHTAVSATQASSVTLYIWQHGAKENYSKFETFNMVVNTKT